MTTMQIDRTVVEQALEALEDVDGPITALLGSLLGSPDADAPGAKVRTAITALRAALAQQAEPVQPGAWKQGNLVTFNEDPYPALGGLFVQFWDGEEVAARVYANDLETLRQRCAKINAAPPRRTMVPLTDEEIDALPWNGSPRQFARAVEKASWEKNHGQARSTPAG